jgi:hypothetical protein
MESVPQTLPNPQAHVDGPGPFVAAGRDVAAKPQVDAPGALRLWHLTSLDAPTVAAVWALGFAWAGGVRLPVWIPVLLALAGWAVYIGDRLMDARRALRDGDLDQLRERHMFHYRHRRVLTPLAGCATVAAATMIFTLMPAAARERNSVLAAAALVYFAGVHWRPRMAWAGRLGLAPIIKKEFLVGMLFTAACALPALSRVSAGPRPALAGEAVLFALLAWLNCHAIDRWEADGGGGNQVFRLACWLTLGGLLLACLLMQADRRAAELATAAAVSSLLLAALDGLRSRLSPLALRAAADLVLLTPLALLLDSALPMVAAPWR